MTTINFRLAIVQCAMLWGKTTAILCIPKFHMIDNDDITLLTSALRKVATQVSFSFTAKNT